METSISLRDILRMIRRRAGMIVTIVVVFSGLAALLAYFIPPTYQAQAKILIESQQIPRQLASSTVTVSTTERLELIEQRLMTRANLLGLIERLDLYAERSDLSKSAKVRLMRESTTLARITVQSGNRRRGATIAAFTLTYRDSNPKRAAQITNEFVTMVLEQNLRARSERASETHDFFKDEVAQIQKDLVAVEAEIASFKAENELALPDTLSYRRQELDRLRSQQFQRKAQVLQLEEQRRVLQNALDTGRYADAMGQSLTAEERDLQNLRIELTRALTLYAESHPTVRTLKSRISKMEEKLRSSDQVAALETETERADRMKGEIERQIRRLDTELALQAEQEEMSVRREAALVDAIGRSPQVAIELGVLERRQSDLKIRYEEAARKQSFAATGEKLEVNRQAERFEVVEQAQVPDRPVSPNRPAIAIGGFAGSLGLALGLAILLGLLNASIRTVADMERKLDMRPLMTVPYISTAREKRRARRELYLLGTLVLVIVPIALYAVDQYYLPLELLIEDFINRTNLRGILNRLGDAIN